MHLPLLNDILVLLGFSVGMIFILQRLKLPSIIGFLLAGMLIGPHGFSLVNAVKQVEIISEIGVIMLLFVIGMELSIKQLSSMKKTIFLGGSIQVGVTVLVSALVYKFLGFSWTESVFVGFLFSLSSTAIVLKSLQDRNETNAPHGRNALAILIYQDIVVVPMMLVTPILAGKTENIELSILTLLVKTAVVVAITVISARYIVPRLLKEVARTNSKELFLLFTITLCFAVAFLTSEAGLSLALGAFMAGLIISESDYSHQATSVILPFRELFSSFFFVSVGMMLDLHFFISNIGVVLLLLLAVFIGKTLITSLAVMVLKYPPRTVLLTALSLFQVGEFAFILSKVGIDNGLLKDEVNQYFLSVSIASMMLTPFIILFSENMTAYILGIRKKMASDKQSDSNHGHASALSNHMVIVGYGINGSNLAKAAKAVNIPFVVIELDADVVEEKQKKGIPVIYGDATEDHILEAANIHHARAVVIAISDNNATKMIISNVRRISQSVFLIVRTRYIKETNDLLAMGANEVIPEEFETSIEIFSRVLHNFLIPENDIEQFINKIRSDNYELFQGINKMPRTMRNSKFPEFNITCLRIHKESGNIIGKPLKDLGIRAKYGVNILGISRREKMLESITPDTHLLTGDILYLHGKPSDIRQFHDLIA